MNLIDKINHKFEEMNKEVEELSGYCIELVPETILELEKVIIIKNGIVAINEIDHLIYEIYRKKGILSVELEHQEEVLKVALTEIGKKINELYLETIEPYAEYLKSADCCYDEEKNFFYKINQDKVFEAINVEKLITELYIYNSLFDTMLQNLGYGFSFTKFFPKSEKDVSKNSVV